MADIQRFLSRVAGKTKQIKALVTSVGAADAGKVVATGDDGRLDPTVLPLGVGAATNIATASEALSAGKFVNFFNDGGVLKVRLADNSNGRAADGFVVNSFSANAQATVYPLDGVNSGLTGLTIGSSYWLGTAGDVISTPLDEKDDDNEDKISQFLGKAKSTTELITTDDGHVVL